MASLTTKFNELSLVLVNGFASAAVVCLLCKHRKERTHEQIDRNHPGWPAPENPWRTGMTEHHHIAVHWTGRNHIFWETEGSQQHSNTHVSISGTSAWLGTSTAEKKSSGAVLAVQPTEQDIVIPHHPWKKRFCIIHCWKLFKILQTVILRKPPCRLTASCTICKVAQQNWRNYSKRLQMPSRNSITCWTYLSKCNASFLDDKVKRASKEIDGLKKKIEVLTANQQKAADPQYQLSAEYFRIKEYSDALIARIVEKVIVLSADEIKIEFVGGYTVKAILQEWFNNL